MKTKILKIYLICAFRLGCHGNADPIEVKLGSYHLITQRAILLNADWSIKRAFFLILRCEEGKITRS